MTEANDWRAEELAAALRDRALIVEDGALGTMIAETAGLAPGAAPFEANRENPAAVTAIHRAYVEAGAAVAITNTFGATRLRLGDKEAVRGVNEAAVDCARAADPRFVAGDIGPLGVLLAPYGDLEPEEALELFGEQAAALAGAGCDLFTIETMGDLTEATLAIRAVRAVSDRPIFVTLSFGESGRTMMGVTPEQAAETLGTLGVAAIGANCSVGPDRLLAVIEAMDRRLGELFGADDPERPALIAKPNAGLPQRDSAGQTVYPLGIEEFVAGMSSLIDAGATVVGGCCGTTPEYIAALARAVAE